MFCHVKERNGYEFLVPATGSSAFCRHPVVFLLASGVAALLGHYACTGGSPPVFFRGKYPNPNICAKVIGNWRCDVLLVEAQLPAVVRTESHFDVSTSRLLVGALQTRRLTKQVLFVKPR